MDSSHTIPALVRHITDCLLGRFGFAGAREFDQPEIVTYDFGLYRPLDDGGVAGRSL